MSKNKAHNSKFVIITRWLVSLLILTVLLWFLYIYAGKLLCHIAIGQIGELTNTRISARSIRFQSNGTVVIDNLVIDPIKSQKANAAILEAKKVYARFDKGSLFLLKPRLNAIDVNDFVFRVFYDIDTGWSNLSDLTMKPPKGNFKKMPDISLTSGTLQYIKISNVNDQISVSVPLEANFGSDKESHDGYIFSVTTATMSSGFGRSHLSGSWKPGSVIITGGISSMNVPEFEMAWVIDVLAAELKYDTDSNYSLELTANNMQSLRSREPNGITLDMPSFIQKYNFFTALQHFLDGYKPKGFIDIELEMAGNFRQLTESNIQGTVKCRDVAFNYYKFPYLIEHLKGNIDFTQNELEYKDLSGKHGDSEFLFNGWNRNFGSNRESEVRITSDSMPLDDDLYEVLNEDQQKFWSLFSPSGNVKVDLLFEKQSEAEREMKLTLGLLDVDALYNDFPYPLDDLTGTLIFDHDTMTIQKVVSLKDDLTIELNGEITTVQTDESVHNISVRMENLPLDSALEAALPNGQKKFFNQFKPTGLVDGLVQVSISDYDEKEFTAYLNFKESSLKFESLSLPVSDISAYAVFTPDLIDVKQFTGMYNNFPVSMSGRIIPAQEKEQFLYNVSLELENIQLSNNELSELLPESIEKKLNQFSPQGGVNITADLKKENLAESTDYKVIVDCLDNDINLPEFPYPIENITGTMTIDSNSIKLENISAFLNNNLPDKLSKAALNFDGEIKYTDANLIDAELQISAQNIFLNEQYEILLPKSCQNLYKTLSPSGQINLDFNKFRFFDTGDGNKTIEFEGEIALDELGFIISGDQSELTSLVQIQGKYITEHGFSNCKAIIDNGTLNILGKTLSGLKTEFCYDPNQQKWSSKNLIADFYEGKTTGTFEFIQEEDFPAEYVLQTAFDDVNLEKFLSDTKFIETEDNTYASGTMSGSLSLSSQINQRNSQVGMCRLTIKDMQIGKLSPLAKILQVLNLTEPSDYAFDSMFIDSYIRKNGLFVEKLDVSGKSVAFYGSGSIDMLSGEVDLGLIARGKRLATDDPSVLQSLTEGLGQAVVRMDVTGDFHDLKVGTRTLPVLEETLQIFVTKPEKTD